MGEDSTPKRDRPVVLLVAEAVTLAHFARIARLAAALDPATYRVVVASDPRYAGLAGASGLPLQPIHSISNQQFTQALAQGRPLYDVATLERYVAEDLALIDRVRPDLVVGDFRLSLAVSAPLRRVPYASVVNAYWSPYADLHYPVPDLPMTRWLGLPLAQRLFDLARPLAFALHARPLNRVRRRHGLTTLGHDLRTCYSWADHTLYADAPEVVPTRPLPGNHRYLGPVLWSTETPLPEWWERLPADRPLVFLTLGSSGSAEALPALLRTLAQLPITLVVARAGRGGLPPLPANIYHAEYLPLEAVLRRARLLICNGGSLSTYQALACGVPTIGVCANLDQLLNMGAIERLGAGILLRAARMAPEALLQATRACLESPSYAQAASHAGAALRQYDAGQRFRDTVAEILA